MFDWLVSLLFERRTTTHTISWFKDGVECGSSLFDENAQGLSEAKNDLKAAGYSVESKSLSPQVGYRRNTWRWIFATALCLGCLASTSVEWLVLDTATDASVKTWRYTTVVERVLQVPGRYEVSELDGRVVAHGPLRNGTAHGTWQYFDQGRTWSVDYLNGEFELDVETIVRHPGLTPDTGHIEFLSQRAIRERERHVLQTLREQGHAVRKPRYFRWENAVYWGLEVEYGDNCPPLEAFGPRLCWPRIT